MDKRILLIVRASTDQQETESQKRELIDYCKTKGFEEAEMEIIEVAGASARKLNKKYIQMLEDIKNTVLSNPTIKNVGLWHLNRLGRVESKLHEMKEFFISNKIQLFVKEPEITLFDEKGEVSAAGGITFSVYASMVKLETDEMFAKMKRGKKRNKELGKYVGGNLKFGYKLDEKKYIIIDEDEATVVRQLFELYATGKYSIYKLVDELNNRGLTSKKGLKFTYNIARKALVTERYYNGTLPLISKELFDKCTEVREKQMAVKFTKETRNVNFAVGLLKCHCGNNYVVSGDFYTCYSKVRDNRRFVEKLERCDSPIVRKEVIDNLLWLVTKRLQQAFLMQVDSKSIAEYKDKINVLNLKVSSAEKEIEGIKERIEKLGDDFYINGKMSEATYNKRLEGLTTKQNQKESEIKNHLKEIEETERIIAQLDLSEADRYLESILLSDLDSEEIEDRKKIKEIMFDNISGIYLQRFDEGKHHCLNITIISKEGKEFAFVYDMWLNNHRKGECCIFYNSKPLYLRNGNVIELNPKVMNQIEKKCGLPVLDNKDLGKAAKRFAERTYTNPSESSSFYTFIPELLSFKNEEANAEEIKAKFNLDNEELEFVDKAADVIEVSEPIGKVKDIINRFLSTGLLIPVEDSFIPNIKMDYTKELK